MSNSNKVVLGAIGLSLFWGACLFAWAIELYGIKEVFPMLCFVSAIIIALFIGVALAIKGLDDW